MKVFIYDNKEKDCGGQYLKELVSLLVKFDIDYELLTDDQLVMDKTADALFTLGGDGTILWLVEFANRNSIPIIGINVGKVGFLTEFERLDMLEAVTLFKNGKLQKDERLTLEINVDGKRYLALNDAYIQRNYCEEIGCMTMEICVDINDKPVENFKGDGVVVSSPTGSTAYSLAVGGAILSPDVQALCVTPIAAHALGLRSIVFSSDAKCNLSIVGKNNGTLFADGRKLCKVCPQTVITVEKSKYVTTFLRKDTYNFYKILSVKIKDGFQG